MNQKIKKGLTYLGKCFICLSILTTIFGCSSSIEKISINESEITMDINEEKTLNLEFTPDDSTIKIDDFQMSDDNIIEIKKIDNQKLYVQSLDHEGKITIQYKKDNVESNIVTIQVIYQKALALAKAKKQAEEEAQKKAEEEKLKAEEAQKKIEEEKIKAQEEQKRLRKKRKKKNLKKQQLLNLQLQKQIKRQNLLHQEIQVIVHMFIFLVVVVEINIIQDLNVAV
ncbi:MAG: hypothetical protein KHZ15_08550 [Coprobacillus cateniformis]|uniref:hypothetical protein n=1 Tax=Longibaculum muris TaxID=1796628 RepID=UPI003AB5A9DE|nr:hypothetical protein [Coprobacillus cateniformis]